MISTGTPEDIDNTYDEVWIIARRMKPLNTSFNGEVYHVPDLAPSDTLLNWALQKKKNMQFDKACFDSEYSPRFLQEIRNNPKTCELIDFLRITDKNILLVCYCKREDICHRSIIKALVKNN